MKVDFIANTKQQMVTSPFIPEMQQSQQNCSLPVFLLCNATYTKQKSAKPRICYYVSCRNSTVSEMCIVEPEILQFTRKFSLYLSHNFRNGVRTFSL